MNRIPLALAAAGTGIPLRTLQRWIHDEWLTNYAPEGTPALIDGYELLTLTGQRGQGGRLPQARHGKQPTQLADRQL